MVTSSTSWRLVREFGRDGNVHQIVHGDARDLSWIDDESVHLVCTSPPYFNLVQYPETPDQLGNMDDYGEFLSQLGAVWEECHRVLVPGGRVACVVGDVLVSRRQGGRHYVIPLGADIQVQAREVGLDCLTPIRWLKVGNIAMEASKSSRYLGKPNLPNGIVKNDIEHILFLRKPGGYRSPTPEQEARSWISTDDYSNWFRPIWDDIPGARRSIHPAPYPFALAQRLIRMFSFVGDVILDPFSGTGTTARAAISTQRASISVDVDPTYAESAAKRIEAHRPPRDIQDAAAS